MQDPPTPRPRLTYSTLLVFSARHAFCTPPTFSPLFFFVPQKKQRANPPTISKKTLRSNLHHRFARSVQKNTPKLFYITCSYRRFFLLVVFADAQKSNLKRKKNTYKHIMSNSRTSHARGRGVGGRRSTGTRRQRQRRQRASLLATPDIRASPSLNSCCQKTSFTHG